MDWKIAEAKQRFSELLRAAEAEPQRVRNRSRLVAIVVSARDAEAFEEWRRQTSAARSLARAVDEIREICRSEDYALTLGSRVDRENALLEVADARRHQRRQ